LSMPTPMLCHCHCRTGSCTDQTTVNDVERVVRADAVRDVQTLIKEGWNAWQNR
jgi:hypothetical protein